MVSTFSVSKTTKQLKFADRVVNEWLSRVENISLDVFLGFNNSQLLENFVTNRTGYPKYKESKVIAGN